MESVHCMVLLAELCVLGFVKTMKERCMNEAWRRLGCTTVRQVLDASAVTYFHHRMSGEAYYARYVWRAG